jgi:hypothetical protein
VTVRLSPQQLRSLIREQKRSASLIDDYVHRAGWLHLPRLVLARNLASLATAALGALSSRSPSQTRIRPCRLGSRRATQIKPADSDRPGGLGLRLGSGSGRLTRIWPRCLESGRAGLIDWLERRGEEETRIPMHADWVGQGCSMRSSAEGLKFGSLYASRAKGRKPTS